MEWVVAISPILYMSLNVEHINTELPKNLNHLIIDGDSLIFRACWAAKNRKVHEAKQILNRLMRSITTNLDTDDYTFLIDNRKDTFCYRENLYPLYKSGRTDKPKPPHITELRELCLDRYNAVLSADGCEVDDDIGDMMRSDKYIDPIVVSIDKDLLQLSGFHYNYVKQELQWVSPDHASFLFASQLITGDRVDDIPGLSERAPKRRTVFPKKFLGETPKGDWIDGIKSLYMDKYGKEDGQYMFFLNFFLLHIGTEGRGNNLLMMEEHERQYW